MTTADQQDLIKIIETALSSVCSPEDYDLRPVPTGVELYLVDLTDDYPAQDPDYRESDPHDTDRQQDRERRTAIDRLNLAGVVATALWRAGVGIREDDPISALAGLDLQAVTLYMLPEA